MKELASCGGGDEDLWHIDGSTRLDTPWHTMLQAAQVPPFGRDTLLASTEAIYERLSAPSALLAEVQLRVTWEPGTVVIWDNESTVHYLVRDFAFERIMHRVMVSPTQRSVANGPQRDALAAV